MILSIYEWIRRFGNIDIIENFLFFSSIYYKKKNIIIFVYSIRISKGFCRCVSVLLFIICIVWIDRSSISFHMLYGNCQEDLLGFGTCVGNIRVPPPAESGPTTRPIEPPTDLKFQKNIILHAGTILGMGRLLLYQ